MTTYGITEIFASFQGEGFHSGVPAIFVRFSGCNRAMGKCLFCDTDYSEKERLTADEIGKRIWKLYRENGGFRHGYWGMRLVIIFTGGEPLLQVDRHLMDILRKVFKYRGAFHLETNGTISPSFNLSEYFDWITLSPKFETLDNINPELLDGRASTGFYGKSYQNGVNELKIVFPGIGVIDGKLTKGWDRESLEQAADMIRADYLYLQSQDDPDFRLADKYKKETVKMLLTGGLKSEWMLSIQAHKYMGVR